MKTSVTALACLVCGFAFAEDAPKYVPVASYRNTPELVKTVGSRVFAILTEHKIKCAQVGSFGMTVSVSENHAGEALQLLAKAIQAEKLALRLLVPKGDRYVEITPDSVLEPKPEK